MTFRSIFTGAGLVLPLFLWAADNGADAARWLAIGMEHATHGDYAGAEEPFHRACLLDAKLKGACLYFGRTLYLLDRYDDAVHVLRTAREYDPRNPEIYRIEALALEASGKSAEAENAFREAIGFNKPSPLNEDPRIDYGVFLYRQGRTEAALEPLRAAVQREPGAARARVELGCVLLELDRAAEAAQQLERAVALEPGNARARLLLDKANRRRGSGR